VGLKFANGGSLRFGRQGLRADAQLARGAAYVEIAHVVLM
jgi:hypothetical protein